jgi:hypothetical protein
MPRSPENTSAPHPVSVPLCHERALRLISDPSCVRPLEEGGGQAHCAGILGVPSGLRLRPPPSPGMGSRVTRTKERRLARSHVDALSVPSSERPDVEKAFTSWRR